MRQIKPRLICVIEQGSVTGIYYEGVDLRGVELVTVDYDTEGSTLDEVRNSVGGVRAWVSVGGVEPVSEGGEDFGSDIEAAYQRWLAEP